MVPVFSLQRSSDKESILTILQVLGDLLSVGEWEEVGGLWPWCLLDSVWFAGGGAPGHVFCQRQSAAPRVGWLYLGLSQAL